MDYESSSDQWPLEHLTRHLWLLVTVVSQDNSNLGRARYLTGRSRYRNKKKNYNHSLSTPRRAAQSLIECVNNLPSATGVKSVRPFAWASRSDVRRPTQHQGAADRLERRGYFYMRHRHNTHTQPADKQVPFCTLSSRGAPLPSSPDLERQTEIHKM